MKRGKIKKISFLIINFFLILTITAIVKFYPNIIKIIFPKANFNNWCRCINNHWIGEKCPEIIKGGSCRKDIRPVVSPRPTANPEITLPSLKNRKPTVFIFFNK